MGLRLSGGATEVPRAPAMEGTLIARNAFEDGSAALDLRHVTPHAGSGAVGRIMEAFRPASAAYLIRFPRQDHTTPGADAIEHAILDILPEPCEVEVLACGDGIFAAVVSPCSGQPFDPVCIHS